MTIKELFDKMTKCNLFIGKYDAKNGSKEFMNGIAAVMEFIAFEISEETYNKFIDDFLKNLLDSERKI